MLRQPLPEQCDVGHVRSCPPRAPTVHTQTHTDTVAHSGTQWLTAPPSLSRQCGSSRRSVHSLFLPGCTGTAVVATVLRVREAEKEHLPRGVASVMQQPVGTEVLAANSRTSQYDSVVGSDRFANGREESHEALESEDTSFRGSIPTQREPLLQTVGSGRGVGGAERTLHAPGGRRVCACLGARNGRKNGRLAVLKQRRMRE